MVKNEEDIIGETISNLLDQGVDHILIADHGSTDCTWVILEHLSASPRIHVIRDSIAPYWQSEKMSHLARTATRAGASWIVPFDGDELWKGNHGSTLAEVLRSTDATVVEASWWNFVPLPAPNEASSVAERFPFRAADADVRVKVAFRANWLARIKQGNHHVFLPNASNKQGLRIAHFRWRSAAQMVRKAHDGSVSSGLAGIDPKHLPQWFELADKDEDYAAELLRQTIAKVRLIYDPANVW